MQLFKLPHCKQQGRLMHDFRPIFRVNGQFHDRLAVHICWDVSVNRPRRYGRLNCGCIFLSPQTFWGPSLHKCVGCEHVLEIREAQCGINNGLSLCLSLLGLGHRRGVKKLFDVRFVNVHSAHVFSTFFFAARWRCHRLIFARVVIQSTDFDKIFDCLFFAAMSVKNYQNRFQL